QMLKPTAQGVSQAVEIGSTFKELNASDFVKDLKSILPFDTIEVVGFKGEKTFDTLGKTKIEVTIKSQATNVLADIEVEVTVVENPLTYITTTKSIELNKKGQVVQGSGAVSFTGKSDAKIQVYTDPIVELKNSVGKNPVDLSIYKEGATKPIRSGELLTELTVANRATDFKLSAPENKFKNTDAYKGNMTIHFEVSEYGGRQVKEIFSIPEPTMIFKAGMSKGKYHDRQDLGFILREDTELRVRQVNPTFKDKLTLRLLGNDSKAEKEIKVGAEWTQISATEALVPFVDTPYGATSAQLEYEIQDTRTQKQLPIYHYQMNPQEFFNIWDQSDGNYALVKGIDFQLLIPKRDKALVKKLKDYSSLDELIEHYNELFAYFNQMAGFDHSSLENENGKNRYFLKADSNGAGGAYYNAKWTANSTPSIDMWLTKNSWGTLHEIAHGYQAGFDGVGMYTGEVSNNLFGVQYQYDKYGKKADDSSWLFNYGNKASVESGLYTKLVSNNGTYDSGDLREKLILLTMLKQKAGNEAFTTLYQEYRKLANQPNFNKKNYPLPDLLNKYYSETSQQDFTPVLERWGLDINHTQAEKNRSLGYPAIASLVNVVPVSELTRAHDLLDQSILINSNFEMVQNKDISSLNLHGQLTIQLKTENIQDLKGIKLSLNDGNKEIGAQTIDGDKLVFDNIPNGVYRLKFSGKQMVRYITDDFYVYVKEKENEATITLKELKSSDLVEQTIQFFGLGDKQFGLFETNLSGEEAVFSVTKKDTHSYFAGKLYSNLTVLDSNNVIKYEKSIEGTNATLATDKIPLSQGDRIEIYHAETKNRLRSVENVIDKTQKTNRWIMTRWGLQNESLKNDPQQNLINKIEAEGVRLLKDEASNSVPLAESVTRKQLLAAVQLLEEPYKTEFMDKFSSLFK
ncbi:putative mucin/carbohydrate-binding domain-containing protein, partial [Enterococcus haemoperoxidus]